jgi:orotate phosphoribosyltransferase
VTSLETGLPFVLVRKSPKRQGPAAAIEGELHPGERVVILEDIVSTGDEVLSTAAKLRAAGAEVIGVLAVVDRQQGGSDAIMAAGLTFEALFRLDELIPERPT